MNILCATDFSKPAMDAADVAAELAKKLNLPLRLVHCADDRIVMGDLPPVEPDDRPLIEELEAEADRLRASGVDVIEDYRRGNPVWELPEAASKHQSTLMVLGSAGKGLAERWLIGSVAEEMAENTPVPTLVVRDAAALLAWLGSESALDLLCGVDLTGSSASAIGWVRRLSGLGEVKVGAVHVHPVEETTLSAEQITLIQRDVWDAAHAALGDLSLTVHVREAFGQPAQEFLKLAEQQACGLMVIGTHQRHGLRLLNAGSFSRRILAHAKSNVLCVPPVPVESEGIPQIRRVLLATDLGALTSATLRHAHSLLRSGGEIRLLHVCHEPSRGVNPVISSEVYFDHSLATAKEREEAEQKINALPSSLTSIPGIKVSSEILAHHDFAAAINDAADRFGADIICMGTKAHSRTGVALLGSTVQAVLARTHRPVFVVTPPAT